MNLSKKRVMITGGSGFLGRHIVARFQREGAEVFSPGRRDYDLTQVEDTLRAFEDFQPQIVVHAAADVGGIGYNRLYPSNIFTNNLRMTTNILEGSKQAGVEKLVIIGSACAYPGEVAGVLKEADFLSGPMHESVECYGFSKRALYLGAKAYRQQYGLNAIFLLLTNLYGPWDKFHPDESHVVAALIRKCVEATQNGDGSVTCWGTGKPIREFLYVEDCAEAIATATKTYAKNEPLNIGTGVGTTIKELAETIRDVVDYQGDIVWDTSKPDGAMKKVLSISRMEEELGWIPKTSLKDGLRKTIDWYIANKEEADMR